MGTLQFVEKGAMLAEAVDMPLFYMNDYSVLGVVVEKLSLAAEVLEENGYQIFPQKKGLIIRFDDARQRGAIFSVLSRRQIDYTLTDLVSCAYQG